jgi:phosphatidylserine/phosphatidylglycerophosphate/cardiolipin synthase-like enzyme
MNAVTVLATSIILTVGLLGATPASAATRQAPTLHAERVVNARPKPAPQHYTPKGGVLVNNPLGDRESRRRIINHLVRATNSVPGKQKIRIATWNFRSEELANALIAAHRRGVSVRVVIDRLNANPDNPNDTFTRLTQGLKHDSKRPADMRSFTRRCVSSCRSAGGIAHTKFYLFTKAGKAKDVAMYGSFNGTDLASYNQWNDLFTIRDHPRIYGHFNKVFGQMIRDKKVAQPYLHYQDGRYTSYFYPYRGAGTENDPLLQELSQIVCAGATDGTGTNGHTKIRIAQTSMHGDRGKAIAGRLRQMWQRGCDIKIVYAVFGNEVLSILRHTNRGPVPIQQIAQDFNLDGVYDRYLHMKTMAVSGVYRGDTSSNVTWNGSANWTSVALASDEVVMRIFDTKVRQTYSQWFDYLYANPPRYSNTKQASMARLAMKSAVARGVDPYSQMELD